MRRELGALALAIATAAAPAEALAAEPPEREPLVFVMNPTFGVETTVRSTDSVVRLLQRYEDALPSVDLNERTVLGKTAGVVGRWLELVLFDEPIAEMGTLVVHEVGGHGARARELGLDPRYAFYLPGIYRALFSPGDHADASAYTQYLTPGVVEGDRAILGTAGGIEANHVHAWWIQARVLRGDGWVHHGDLLAYSLDKLSYATSFANVPSQGDGANDVASYVTGLADRRNLWRDVDRRRIERRVSSAYLWNVFDPMLLYALYGTLVSSLWKGERWSRVPLPRIGGTIVLPSPRFGLSPFGAEQTLDLFFARGRTLLDVYARVGTTGLWDHYGAGARLLGIRANERVTLGGELDVWRQPELLLDERGVFDRPMRLGMNAGAFADIHVAGPIGMTGKLAAKTPGFVPGQPVSGGVHGYLGMSVAW